MRARPPQSWRPSSHYMRFKITTTNSQLPLVTEIPDFDGIVRLEGLNGTGKSLTTEILALCAGRRLSTGETWRTLCEGLGDVRVEASQLAEGKHMMWCFSGLGLLGAPVDEPLSWFDEIKVDGRRIADFGDVQSLFGVEILKGDVGLVETLASQIDEEARQARAVASERYAGTMAELGDLLEALKEQAEQLRPEDVRKRRRDLADAQRALEEAKSVADCSVEHLRRLQRMLESSVSLEQARASAGQLADEISELQTRIAALEGERRAVLDALQQLEVEAADTAQLAADLKKAEQARKRALTAVENRANELKDLVEAGQVPSGTPLDEEMATCVAAIQAARREQLALDARPAVLSLVEELVPPLDGAIGNGLGGQELLRLGEEPVAVDDVRASLEQQRTALRAGIESGSDDPLEEEIARLEGRLKAMKGIPQAAKKHAAAEERLDNAEVRIAELSRQLDDESARALDELRSRRTAIDHELIEKGGDLRILEQRAERVPTPSQQQDERRWLDEELREVGLELREVATATEQAAKDAERDRDAQEHAKARVGAMGEAVERDASVLRSLHETVASERFAWLHQAVPNVDPHQPDDLVAMLEALTQILDYADSRYDELRGLLDGVPSTLSAIANELRGRDEPATYAREALEAWAATLAAEWFEQGAVGDLLLGRGAHDVSVDIRSRLVRWTDSETSEERRRPLNALSSGQQAFTFTRARLALLQQRNREAANRLLVLDEYGAFVSHDRLRLLEQLLVEWHASHPDDQILLILPAVQDYAALIPTALGEQRATYEARAKALDRPGYFTERLDVA